MKKRFTMIFLLAVLTLVGCVFTTPIISKAKTDNAMLPASGPFYIQTMAGLNIDIENGDMDHNKANVIINSADYRQSQLFWFHRQDDGSYVIDTRTGKSLTVDSLLSRSNGTNVCI